MIEFMAIVGTEAEFDEYLSGDREDLSRFEGRVFKSVSDAREYRDRNPEYPKIYQQVRVGARLVRD